jgi:hypothetical protein
VKYFCLLKVKSVLNKNFLIILIKDKKLVYIVIIMDERTGRRVARTNLW